MEVEARGLIVEKAAFCRYEMAGVGEKKVLHFQLGLVELEFAEAFYAQTFGLCLGCRRVE